MKALIATALIATALIAPAIAQRKKKPASMPKTETVCIIEETTPFLKAPSIDADDLGTLKRYDKVTRIIRTPLNNYVQVRVGKQTGWIEQGSWVLDCDKWFSQDEPKVEPEPEIVDDDPWKLLVQTSAPDGGVTTYVKLDSARKQYAGSYEIWAKDYPRKPATFRKMYKLPKTFSYIMKFVTVYCNENRLSIEKTTAFTANGNVVPFPMARNFFREPVVPGSVGEEMVNLICGK